MQCSELVISEYIDGDLSVAATRELELHLAACSSCRVILSELSALVAATRLLGVDFGSRATGDQQRIPGPRVGKGRGNAIVS